MKSYTLLLSVSAYVVASAHAATFTVIKTADSGPGTLRQAILNANAAPGEDKIGFNIPGSGVRTIAPVSPLPTITGPVKIDGYTQSDASPNTRAIGNNAVLRIELAGNSPGAGSIGLQISGGSSTVRGLVLNRWSDSAIQLETAGNNTIAGNFIGSNPAGTAARSNSTGIRFVNSSNNQVGGTTRAARNLFSGNTSAAINMFRSSGNVLEGNYFGTDRSGTAVLDANVNAIGLILGAECDGNRIGGTDAAARNVISGHGREAILMTGTFSNVVQGNYIGTDVTGEIALGNGLTSTGACAVCVLGNRNPFGSGGGPALDNRIGGTEPGAGNVIAGSHGSDSAAVFIGGTSAGNIVRANANFVQGNFIGTNKDGTVALPNQNRGIYVQDGDDNLIGGTEPGAANIIANNLGTRGIGVAIGDGVRNRILGNSIYNNARRGIEFEFGPEFQPNDTDDPDTGGNNLQNHPIITSVEVTGGTANIAGILNSTPATVFRLEFFSSPAAGVSGYGEGKTLLGSANVTTNAGGNATFDVTFPVPPGEFSFAATATDATGNTSEFGPAYRVRLLNISTRMRVLSGERVLIGGFIISGADPKKVIIRGIGPSLGGAAITDPIPDPVLQLNRPGSSPVTNDNWRDTQEEEIQDSGVPPPDNAESAIVITLDPGVYTAILSEKNNVAGVGLVEIFDLNSRAGSRLANISTRGFVDTGNNVMIGGFIAGPAQVGPVTVLIRAIGPSLAGEGVGDPLQDPTLELFDTNGTKIEANDDWKDTDQAAIVATGAPPTDDAESALLTTLPASNYTAIVRGKDNTTGVALVEVYDIQ